jgi:hypothetical protein
VRNSALVNNVAGSRGGALYLSGAQFVLHSVTSLNNVAPTGTAVWCGATSGPSNVTNSILYGAASGSAWTVDVTNGGQNLQNPPPPAVVRLTNNIIKGYNDTATCPANDVCATGTINADPLLTQVIEPQPDGGPVDTFWVPASASSPAVDSGDNTGGDAFDMRGAARVVGASVDRGAVEFVPAPSPPPVAPQPNPPPAGPPPAGPNNNLPPCPTGTAPGTGNCVCAPGDGGASCNQCGAGTFSPGGSGATCSACVGDTSAKPGASACIACAAPGATADKSACRKAPVRAASRFAYTTSRMARLRVPVPGLLTGVSSDFAPLTVSLKYPSLNGVTQEDGSSITVNADGSFVYTPPTLKGSNATIEFRVTDANGDALEEAVSVLVTGAFGER